MRLKNEGSSKANIVQTIKAGFPTLPPPPLLHNHLIENGNKIPHPLTILKRQNS